MYEPNGTDRPPHAREWSPFELLLIAVAVVMTLMALVYALPVLLIALGD